MNFHEELIQVIKCYTEFQLAFHQTISKLRILKINSQNLLDITHFQAKITKTKVIRRDSVYLKGGTASTVSVSKCRYYALVKSIVSVLYQYQNFSLESIKNSVWKVSISVLVQIKMFLQVALNNLNHCLYVVKCLVISCNWASNNKVQYLI